MHSWLVSRLRATLSASQKNNDKLVATVWLADSRTVSDQILDACRDWLSPSESQRYSHFIRPQRQRQFLIGRSMLRIVLSRLLAIVPQDILLEERSGQAPTLKSIVPLPGYSISHSGDWIACAVSRHTALGLDIEYLHQERDTLALAEQTFDAATIAQLRTLNAYERNHAFYQQWTKSEAAYKLASAVEFASEDDDAPSYLTFPHPDLAITLCSQHPLHAASLHVLDAWPSAFPS